MPTNGIISLCDGRRTDVRDVTGIWAHSVTGRSVSNRYGKAGIQMGVTRLQSTTRLRLLGVNLKQITAERVDMYRQVLPPGENIPVSVEPFQVEDSVSMDEKIE